MHAMPRPGARAQISEEAADRRWLRVGLGVLWIVDALLQLQPGMFTMDMTSDIMQPSATGEPAWLQHSIDFSIRVITPHLVFVNLVIVIVQAGIGLALLLGSPRQRVWGAWASIIWGALVWYFGEGLGQLLTGSATFLAGAPGSVLLYGLAGAILLSPGPALPWLRLGRYTVSWALALASAVLVLGGFLQLNPLFFTTLGLAAPVGQGAMMAQPRWIQSSLGWALIGIQAAPVWINLGLVLALVALAILVLVRGRSLWVMVALGSFLTLVWWFGQDVGGLFTGMATDPNTAVPLMLLAWAGYVRAPKEMKESDPG